MLSLHSAALDVGLIKNVPAAKTLQAWVPGGNNLTGNGNNFTRPSLKHHKGDLPKSFKAMFR